MSGAEPSAAGRTVERALSLLALVCERGQASLVEAARALDLSPSTTLRLLRTLETQEYVRRDESGGYRPGAKTIRVGAQALGHERVVAAGRAELDRIALETGESAYLSVLGHASTALYVAIAEGSQMVRYVSWVGLTIPVEGTAAGRALTGGVPAGGFAAVRGDLDAHAVEIAVPVLGADDSIEAALSVVIPVNRVRESTEGDVGALLVGAAQRITEQLRALEPARVGGASE